jgi:hypothetical protein
MLGMRGRPWRSLGAGVATLALSSCTLLTDLGGLTSESADGGASGDAASQRDGGTTPRLDLQFAADKSLVDRVAGTKVVSFERSSKATYTGLDGLLKSAASDEPRFDHDPSSKESLGLLIEESRTNLLLGSALLHPNRPAQRVGRRGRHDRPRRHDDRRQAGRVHGLRLDHGNIFPNAKSTTAFERTFAPSSGAPTIGD